MESNFHLLKQDTGSHARAGELFTAHGAVPTPVFMPVGSQATVKTLTPDELKLLDYRLILANNYHLYLRPGVDLIQKLGGLHHFMGWDGVQAELKGVDLAVFPLAGSCVPDYYTPVLIAGESTLANQADLTRRFLRATVRGYEYAIENPAEAAEILLKYSPESDPELVRASQAYLSPRYQDDAAEWGLQEPVMSGPA